MELCIRTDSTELTDALRDLVTKRIRLALDAFGDRILDAFVYLMDLSGPNGNGNKLCLISVRVHGLAEMVVRETAPTEVAALNRAARRVTYRVSEALRNADRPSSDHKNNLGGRITTAPNRATLSQGASTVPAVAARAQRRTFSGTYSG